MKKLLIIIFLILLFLNFGIYCQDDPSGATHFNYSPDHHREIYCILDDPECYYNGIYTYWESWYTNEMSEYRYFNQDYGWTFDFSNINILGIHQVNSSIPSGTSLQNGKILTRAWLGLNLAKPGEVKNASMKIETWDVDSPEEKDYIYFDEEIVRELNGYPGILYIDNFEDIPLEFFNDYKLNVMLDIDAEHNVNYWALQIGWSALKVNFKLTDATGNLNLTSKRNEVLGPYYDFLEGPITFTEPGFVNYFLETWDQRDETCSLPNIYNCNRTLIRPVEENIFFNEANPRIYYDLENGEGHRYFEVQWLPADYEKCFNVTCYYTPVEEEFKGGCLKKEHYNWCSGANPPSECYNNKFMRKVMRQGSGRAKNGEIVQYLEDQDCYYISDCPRTSSGRCAQAGRTIAVDRSYENQPPVIPWLSTVNINGTGERVAEDTGHIDQIDGYDIDVYQGFGESACYPSPWDGEYWVKFIRY